jgi:hypothetical protein
MEQGTEKDQSQKLTEAQVGHGELTEEQKKGLKSS